MQESKMASSKRGKRSLGFFADLHKLSTADFAKPSCRKKARATIEGGRFFEVDRLVSARKGKEGREYLVKWTGYSPYECTWEPENHLNTKCLKYFEKPFPEEGIVFNEVSQLRVAVARSLKTARCRKPVTVEFRQDVFKYLFHGKGTVDRQWHILQKGDLRQKYFPEIWDCLLDQHGQGTRIHYPIRIRHFITWSPKNFTKTNEGVHPAAQAFQEKVTVKFIKVAA